MTHSRYNRGMYQQRYIPLLCLNDNQSLMLIDVFVDEEDVLGIYYTVSIDI